MIAYGISDAKGVGEEDCFICFETAQPVPGPRDLLVRIRAVAVNPVDAKVRAMQTSPVEPPRILGWDAAGVVEAVGSEVISFRAGDAVYYAGDITRPGCNAEFQCVDERIVGAKPQSLTFPQAASLPLTALTAWEGLFDRMRVKSGQTLLIIGGAGGVGSIAIQLAKQAGLTVIATASRPESAAWCREMGADLVIDHSKDLLDQCQSVGHASVDNIANFFNTEAYWDVMSELIAPQGSLLLIVEPRTPLRLGDPLKAKCISIHWEFMFARAKFQTADMSRQGEILGQLSAWVDQGVIRHSMMGHGGSMSVETLRNAHELMESSTAVGKLVLSLGEDRDENLQ
jgi:NADPH2:quinone reductase